jgi:2-dehydro-3-deoxyphosphogluconate aldolase / (4S)-4-hydroxy-2-oxoglutarate aldolase
MPIQTDIDCGIQRLINPGVIAVVRARQSAQVLPLSRALLAGGVIAIEITLTTPNAVEAIRETASALGAEAFIGVGTVLDTASCVAAISAGARFVVSPVLRPELVPIAHAGGCPIMLGAYTPTEAQQAHEAGADFVKIFPADGLGPAYIKALRAPLPHLRIVPTGGVDLNTAPAFLEAGCAALGVGSSLVSNQILDANAWSELTSLARAFVQRVQSARNASQGGPLARM